MTSGLHCLSVARRAIDVASFRYIGASGKTRLHTLVHSGSLSMRPQCAHPAWRMP